MSTTEKLQHKFDTLFPHLNERQQHLVAAFDAQQLGRGGISIVSRVTGFSRPTIYRAIESLSQRPLPVGRVRHSGAGRKALVQCDPQLLQALEALVDPDTRGDPMSPLRWTCKSTRELARLLTAQGHPVSHMTVAQLLHDLHYSLQGNAKTKEGKQHLDRMLRFATSNARASRSWAEAGRSSRSTPRRRNWLETTGIPGKNGSRQGNLLRWTCMISPTRTLPRPYLVVSTMSSTMKGG